MNERPHARLRLIRCAVLGWCLLPSFVLSLFARGGGNVFEAALVGGLFFFFTIGVATTVLCVVCLDPPTLAVTGFALPFANVVGVALASRSHSSMAGLNLFAAAPVSILMLVVALIVSDQRLTRQRARCNGHDYPAS